jgi:outer membrane protein TolC
MILPIDNIIKKLRIILASALCAFSLSGYGVYVYAQEPLAKEEIKPEKKIFSDEKDKPAGQRQEIIPDAEVSAKKVKLTNIAVKKKDRQDEKKGDEQEGVEGKAKAEKQESPPAAPQVKPAEKSAKESVTDKLYDSVVDKIFRRIRGVKKGETVFHPRKELSEEELAKAEPISVHEAVKNIAPVDTAEEPQSGSVSIGDAVKGAVNYRPGQNSIPDKIVDHLLSYPVDGVKALSKEVPTILSVGQWDGVPRKKASFSREVGLAGMKASEENKPVQVLSLKECMAIAEKNHLPLQIAKKSIKLAEIRVFEARRNLLPTVTIGFEESTGRVNDRAYISKKNFFEGQQPVFHGGELHYNLKQTQANLEITRNDYDRIRNELVLQVKKAYYSLAKAKENLRIQQELSAETDKIYEMVKSQHDAKIATKLEFLNVSSQVGQVKYQLASASGDESVAELILKQAMNINTNDRIDIVTSPPLKKIDIDFQNALGMALVNRPEMRINLLMIDYYNYGKGIARAKGLPKVDILGQWGMAKDEYMSLDQGPGDDRKMSQQWYAGVKASMPLWGSTAEYSWTREQWVPSVSVYQGTESDTHALKLKILDKLGYYSDMRLAQIDYEKARQELIKIRQDVTLEVREGCFNYEKALIQLDTASSKVEYQAKDLEVSRMKRSLDEMADSNVVESMIKLAQEKFGYAQAVSDCRISLASINKAIGVEDFYKDE